MIINENKRFIIHKDWYIETDKAFGLFPKRSDGVVLHKPEYFPKSQINPKVRSDKYLEVSIPDWLFNKKLIYGYTIMEG
jgi:hypothetical protein